MITICFLLTFCKGCKQFKICTIVAIILIAGPGLGIIIYHVAGEYRIFLSIHYVVVNPKWIRLVHSVVNLDMSLHLVLVGKGLTGLLPFADALIEIVLHSVIYLA